MPKGTLLHLTASTIGLDSVNGQRRAVMIPEGATVRVIRQSHSEDRMIDVDWEGRAFAVFAVDLAERGKEVKSVKDGRSASA